MDQSAAVLGPTCSGGSLIPGRAHKAHNSQHTHVGWSLPVTACTLVKATGQLGRSITGCTQRPGRSRGLFYTARLTEPGWPGASLASECAGLSPARAACKISLDCDTGDPGDEWPAPLSSHPRLAVEVHFTETPPGTPHQADWHQGCCELFPSYSHFCHLFNY